MLRKWNRFIAFVLAFALIASTFNSDIASVRVFAEGEEQQIENTDALVEEVQEESETDESGQEESQEESAPPEEETPQEEYQEVETPEEATPENKVPVEELSDQATEGSVDAVEAEATNGGEVKEEPATEAAEEATISATESTSLEAESTESAAAATSASIEESAEAASSASTIEEKEQNLVTVKYKASMGGRVSVKEETIDLNDEEAELEGSEATAWDRYQFTEWVDEDGNFVTNDALLVPSDVEKDVTFTAKFMKLEEMPEIQEQVTTGGMNVSVKADEGLFPEGTTVSIEAIPETQALETAQDTLGDSVKEAKGVDIKFIYEGAEIQPADAQYVHVSISLVETIEGTDFTVLHQHDGEVKEIEADVTTEEKNDDPEDETKVATGVEFESNEFSVYIVVSQDDSAIGRKMVTYTFVYGDEETVYYEQTVKSGDTLNNPGNPPQLDNNVFMGWYIDGENEELALPMTIDSTDDLDAEVKVVAKYQQTYYVTFHSVDGGIHDVKAVTVEGDDVPYIQVDDEEVAAPTNMQAFKGWTTVKDDRSTLIVADESGKCRVNAKLVKDVYPLIVDAYWVYFDENDDTVVIIDGEEKTISGGASYTGPQFLEDGNLLENARQTDPSRNGYIFAGWSFDADGNEMVAETGEKSWKSEIQTLVAEGDNTVTLYAQWTPVDETKFTIVVWKQKVTDKIGEEKHYDFYISDDTHTGRTGDEIPYSSYESYTKLTTTEAKEFEGFYYAGTEIKASKVVAPNTIGPKGDTVVNVYYDRKTMNLVFNADGIGDETVTYEATSSNRGTQYGYIDGEYILLTRHGRSWGLGNNYYWTYGNGKTYYETRYYRNVDRGDSITYTGLFGQSISYANPEYEWPSGTWQGKKSDGSSSYATFFSDFLFNGWTTSDTTNESTLTLTRVSEQSSGNRHIYFYKQGFDGIDEYDKYVQDHDHICNNNTTFTSRGDYYTGFSPYKYKKGNGEYTSLAAGTKITIDSNTSLYYSRNKYKLTFFYNTQPGEPNTMSQEISDIYYEADISDLVSEAPLKVATDEDDGADNLQYKFVGWYADDTLTTPFDWSTTMPAANVSVYAKWEVKRHNVKINFDGGTETVSTDFDIDYGEKVSKTALMSTTKEGWRLAGWVHDEGDPDAGKVFNFGETIRDIKIKAVWKKSGNINVVYDAGEYGNNAPVDSETYSVDSGVVVAIPPSVNDGWVFTGWKVGGNVYTSGEVFTITSNLLSNNVVTLVAQYEETIPSSDVEEETTSITYDANGGTDGARTSVKVTKNDSGEDLRVNEAVTALTVDQAQFAKTGYSFVGWNTDSSKKEAKYLAGDIITLDKEENVFYAITSKTIKIKFHKEGTDNDGVIENNCTIYNKETTCDFIIPTFNKAGAFNISWSKTLGGQPVSYYRSGLSIKINSDLDLYASFRYPINYSDTLYKERSIPIVKSLTVGNSLFEYEEGIPLDKIENHYNFMKEVYSKIPFLFVPGKAFVLDSDTYKDISIAYGVTYAAGHEEYFFIDLQYDSKGYVVRNEVDDNATIHELAHAWDYYYRYKKGSRISDQPDIVSFYNSLTAEKRNNLTRVEWFAGVVTEYYWHYLGMNPNKPSYGGYKANYSEEEKEQLVNLLEKYINISKNGYN